MKIFKGSLLYLIFLFLFLVGCNNDKEILFDYSITKDSSFFIEGISNIETYSDYEKLTRDVLNNLNYDESYFEDSGLIMYGTKEGSGSVKVNIDSVDLFSNYDVLINIKRETPVSLTTDVKEHQFIIEYKKTTEKIAEVNLKIKTIKTIIWYDLMETKKKTIEKFIKKNDVQYINVSVFSKKSEEVLSQLNGEMFVSQYTPLIRVRLDSVDDLDFELLSKLTDDNINVNISIFYKIESFQIAWKLFCTFVYILVSKSKYDS